MRLLLFGCFFFLFFGVFFLFLFLFLFFVFVFFYGSWLHQPELVSSLQNIFNKQVSYLSNLFILPVQGVNYWNRLLAKTFHRAKKSYSDKKFKDPLI